MKLQFAKPCRFCGSVNGHAKFVSKYGDLCVHYEVVEGVVWPASLSDTVYRKNMKKRRIAKA
jgi:hypothetical protein